MLTIASSSYAVGRMRSILDRALARLRSKLGLYPTSRCAIDYPTLSGVPFSGSDGLVTSDLDGDGLEDIDRDGDLDLVGTRGNSSPYDGVFWLEQVRTKAPGPACRRARAEDSREMPVPTR